MRYNLRDELRKISLRAATRRQQYENTRGPTGPLPDAERDADIEQLCRIIDEILFP